MKRRNLSLKKYGISNKRYKELCGFCEQYPEWKEKLDEMNSNMKAIEYTDMPIYHSNSDTTMKLAIKRSELSDKCNLIEDAAREAGGEYLFHFLIENICYEEPVSYLIHIENMACSPQAFYDTRRYFFWILDKKKH